MQAELARERSVQAKLNQQLEEIDKLDPERNWFGSLGQIRRAVIVSRAAGGDIVRQLRTRTIWWSALFAIIAAIGIAVGVLVGGQLSGLATSLSWVVAAVGVIAALATPIKQVWVTATEVGDTARAKLSSSKTERAKRIRQLEDDLARVDPARQLDALLRDISSTDRYGSYRGLLGRISQDLERLNRQLVIQYKSDSAMRWRIILYIDDLDRCSAERVVEVLQAVNLLMGMELFFVVVAIDPRWLFAALDQHHRHLFANEASQKSPDDQAETALSGRALDYLDKIFQIPYALRPVGNRGREYLRSLLPDPDPDLDSSSSQKCSVEPKPNSREEHVTTPPRVALAPPDTIVQNRSASAPSAPERRGAAAAIPITSGVGIVPLTATAEIRQPGVVSIKSLRLSHAEVEFLPRLAGLLPTPRAIKKLSNLYRLLRIAFRSDA